MLPKIALSKRQSELRGVAGVCGVEELLKGPAATNVGKDASEIELVRHCSGSEDSDGTWLIELAVDSQSDPSMEDKQVYVQLKKKNNTFLANNIQESLPAGCAGEVPLREERELPSR